MKQILLFTSFFLFVIAVDAQVSAPDSNYFAGQHAGALNTTGKFNTGVGVNSLSQNSTGYANTAGGFGSLFSNTSGSYNTAYGIRALFHNTTGTNNVGVGPYALYNNTEGYGNTASGSGVMESNTSGNSNTASGFDAMHSNTNGSLNVATGFYALFANTTGDFNTASGLSSLVFNTTGNGNTANGYGSMFNNVSGNYNTTLGYFAGPEATDLSNTTAIGANATITASNQVRIGDNTVTSIGGYVEWSNISDGRVKKNIKEDVPGLTFINKLKPVTYNLNLDAVNRITGNGNTYEKYTEALPPAPQLDANDMTETGKTDLKNIKAPVISAEQLTSVKTKEQVLYTGFVAQDVEKAAKELNYDFSGVDAAKNDKDLYGLRYSEFVVPLVKAVQELSAKNDEKDALISGLQKQIDELRSIVLSVSNSTGTITLPNALLEQNVPNPFTNSTTISYSLPNNFISAYITITNKAGQVIKQMNIAGTGKGILNVDAKTLAAGAYSYSLIADGNLISTKQMILAK